MDSLGKLQASMGDIAKQVHKSCTDLSKQVERRLADVERHQQQTGSTVQRLSDKIERLEQILGLMQSESPPVRVEDSSFDRDPDPTVLVLRAKAMLPKANLDKDVVQPILERNNLTPTDVQLDGDPAGRRSLLRLNGNAQLAARRVRQITGSFNISASQWQRFSTADTTGAATEVFISTVKSQKQVQTELLTKKLKATLSELYPTHHFHGNRDRGEISTQWKPLVRATPQPGQGSEPTLEFVRANLAQFGFSADQIRAKFKLLAPPAEPAQKINYMKKLLGKGWILGIQESHGTLDELRDLLYHIHFPTQAFYSFLPASPHDAGGVITFVPDFDITHAADDRPSISEHVLTQGRALNVRILFPSGVLISHFSIHNHGLSSQQRTEILDAITSDLPLASADPLKIFVIVGGDFNFSEDPPVALDSFENLHPPGFSVPLEPSASPSQSGSGSGRLGSDGLAWNLILGHMTEVQLQEPTHHCAAQGALRKLDRIYASAPGWSLTQWCASGRAHGYPEVPSRARISDHGAVSATFSARSPKPPGEQPIHQDIFRRHEYHKFIQDVLGQVDDSEFPPPFRLAFHKETMIEAARHTRDRLLRFRHHDPLSRYIAIRTIARAVWGQNALLAQKNMASHPLGAQFLVVDPLTAQVSINDPAIFAALAAEIHAATPSRAQSETRQRLR
ncbi:unnamed protein product, partial [Prorocentrum cordatum]